MKDALIEFLSEKGVLITPEALDYVEKEGEDMEEIRSALSSTGELPYILGVDKLKPILDSNSVRVPLPEPVGEEKLVDIPDIKAKKSVTGGTVHILRDVTGKSRSTAKVESFVSTVRDRYSRIYRLLKGKPALKYVRKISDASKKKGEDISVIGMVREVKKSPRGVNIVLEDFTGVMDVFFSKKDIREVPLPDEVIGVHGRIPASNRGKNVRMYGNRIVWPDIAPHKMNLSEEKVSMAFISDLHVGNKTFLKDAWDSFVKWLKSEDAKGIGYLLIAGDVVDGIGIYPDQEEELEISDIYEQYEALSDMVDEIPERISVIMIPGNHDFVRPAEPQPAFDEDIKKLFSRDITFAGNPSMMEIEGVKILAYHGTSINDFINLLPGVSYEDPSLALIRMLKSRLLAPVYGAKTPLAPEKEDYMVIDEVPDIFVTGHVHSFIKANYKGVKVINASTWQSQTKYQKLNNFKPEPGVVSIVELDTGRMYEKRFCG